MKQNKAVFASSAAIIIMLTAGYWWFTSSQYVDALVSANTNSDPSSAVSTQDGISGATKQSSDPVVHPFGDSAGGVVDARGMTVAQVVANLDATQFASLFSEERGAALVSGSGSFTVFAPTNGALDRLPAGTIARMSASEKARFVAYHVVKGRALDTDAVLAGTVQAASGDMLNVNFGVNKMPLVGSAIVVTEYDCKNGVVYTINNALVPPQK